MRIVSLNCSNTEIVCALGCADALVAVDDHSDYPGDVVASLPRVGPDLGIDIGKVRACEPDLVLASLTVPGHERVIEGLERAGLPFLAPEPTSLEDVYRDIETIAAALGMSERGAALVAELRARIHGNGDNARAPSILVQWWPKPVIAPGARSWVDDLIHLAGARNPLAADEVKSRPLTDAAVAQLDPDAIVLSWCGVKPEKYRREVVYRNPVFAGMTAVRRRQVFAVAEGLLGRPSPRLADGFDALCRIVGEIDTRP